MKRFLWRFFQNGLDALMIVFSMRAAKTKTPWDDEIVRLAESIGDKFIPGQVSADGKAWIDAHNGWGKFTMSEFLPGTMFGFDSLWKDGKLIGYSLKERLRYLITV